MLPVLLGVLLFILAPVAIWLGRMSGAGDVGRWAEISSMWLLLPVIVALIILFIVLIVLIYMTVLLAAWVPTYSLRAQKFADKTALLTRRGSDMVHKPFLALRALGSAARSQMQRIRERA